MGENQTLNYSQGGLLALHQLRAAAGGVTSEEEEIPPLPLGWSLGVPRNRSKASPVVPREVQVSDYCKQINALKGTAENVVSNQQHLMAQDAVGSSHQ